MSIKRQRKREFKIANQKLEDLVLKYTMIQRSIKAYEKDIEKNDKKIDKWANSKSKKKDEKIAILKNNNLYSARKRHILIDKKKKVEKDILIWKDKRDLCR